MANLNNKITLKRFRKNLTSLNPAYFFLITATFFGLLYVFINPPLFGLDERAHFMRTHHTSNFNFKVDTSPQSNLVNEKVPKNMAGLVNASTEDLLDNDETKFPFSRHDYNHKKYEKFKNESVDSFSVIDNGVNTQLLASGPSSPLSYLHLSVAYLISKSANLSLIFTMYFLRVTALALYILIIFYAIKKASNYKWVLAAVALLPAALFQASIISMDHVVIATMLLLSALAINGYSSKQQGKYDYLLITLALTILILTKFPYVFIVIVFLLMPKTYFASKNRQVIQKILWVIVPFSAFIAWTLVNSDVSKAITILQPNGPVSIEEQLRAVIYNPIKFIGVILWTYYQGMDSIVTGALGRIGDRYIGIPALLMYIISFLIGALSVLIGNGQNKLAKKPVRNVILPVLTALLVVGIFTSTALYLTFTSVRASIIQGIQGRYLIPILPLLLFSIAHALPLAKLSSTNYIKPLCFLIILFQLLTVATYGLVNY